MNELEKEHSSAQLQPAAIIHLMHDGAYQRLNQWPGVLRYVMEHDPRYQAWIRCEDVVESKARFAELARDFPSRVRFLSGKKLSKFGSYVSGLHAQLRAARPTALIVSGYHEPYYLQGLLYAKLHGLKIAFVWESHALSSRHRTGPVAFARKMITHLYDRFITPGSRASGYLQAMGVKPEQISQGINATDMHALKTHIDALKPSIAPRAKTPVRFLYLGRYLTLKGVLELLQAFKNIPAEQATLACVGYGEIEAQLKQYAEMHQMHHVEFLPAFTEMQTGVNHYLNADVMVMPSLMKYGRTDVWGFVVNEALACGCYVVAGETIGALPELITQADYDVGVPVNPENHQQFVATLKEVIAKIPDLDREKIAAFGQSIGPEKMGDAFLDALQKL